MENRERRDGKWSVKYQIEQFRNRGEAGVEKKKEEGNMEIVTRNMNIHVTKRPQKLGWEAHKEGRGGKANYPIGIIR